RYTQGVDDDINRLTVFVIRHIFNRHNDGDNPFVTMTSRHFVARLDAAFDGKINLDDFQYTWCQIITGRQLAFFIFKTFIKNLAALSQLLFGAIDLLIKRLVRHTQFEPLIFIQTIEYRVSQGFAFLNAFAGNDFLTQQRSTQTLKRSGFHDAVFFVQVFTHFIELGLLNFQTTLIFFQTITGKDLYVDNGTFGARRNTQSGVFYIGRLFTEDSAQQFFFWSQLGFTFSCQLTNQNIANTYFCADTNNTRFIQLAQRTFRDVGDIRGNFFTAQLGITCDTRQFLNMDSGETIFLHHTLRNQNGVFEVVTVPGHKCDAHVLTQSQLTHIDRRTVGKNIAAG